MAKEMTDKSRLVEPCWYCGDIYPILVHNDLCFGDVRDKRWYICAKCGATTKENPSTLGEPLQCDKEAFWWRLSSMIHSVAGWRRQ